MFLKQRTSVIAGFQAALVVFALVSAWLLRFDFTLPNRKLLLITIPVLVAARMFAIWRFNLLHGYWRYTGVSDAVDVGKAVAFGSMVFVLVVRYGMGIKAFPISVYLIEACLSALLLGGVRLAIRAAMEVAAHHVQNEGPPAKRVLIVGAGFAGQMLARELQQPDNAFIPVGFVDDNPLKIGVRVHGFPILGSVDDLVSIARSRRADEILIAIPSATSAQMRRIVSICEQSGLRFRTVPSLVELAMGESQVSQLRQVNLQDLLGREPVQLDLEPVRRKIAETVVLVTGAAGSIGSELCRQVLQYAPAQLVCVDQDETGLFNLQHRLAALGSGVSCRYIVADICDAPRMRSLLLQYKVNSIFHAAAYKHVPMMEYNVHEAVKNNVFGLNDLLNIAEECGCDRFLLISSDKAVNPTSLMGCTKRIGELLLSSRPYRSMACISVRFGNVLGSQGSVVPLFQEQIAQHSRITVTHPEMTRFFMTIPEAVSLVLQGFSAGEHGDILVLDMGEPIRILDMARTLVRLSGKRQSDVEIVFTGLRKGEKLYEELFYQDEEVLSTGVNKLQKTRAELLPWPQLQNLLRDLRDLLPFGRESAIRSTMKRIVPQYRYLAPAEAEPSYKVKAAVGAIPEVPTLLGDSPTFYNN